MTRPTTVRVSLRLFRQMQSTEIGLHMHLSLRDFEDISCGGVPFLRRYVRYPHLLFCAKCRKELKSYNEDRTLISDVKNAYAREETIHLIRASRMASRHQ